MNNINSLAKLAYNTVVKHGFDDYEDHLFRKPMLVGLMHSELSELMEAIRDPDLPQSNCIDGYSAEEEEAADVIIRVLAYAGEYNLDIGGAVAAKMFYNNTRQPKHGGKLF